MENSISKLENNYELDYQGKGEDLFGITIINWLLTVVTLGFYYPWAKAKKLQYLYSNTTLNNEPFAFHGTGKEMFKGFIKALLIFVALYGVLFLFVYLEMPGTGLLLFYLGFLAILPIAIHGAYRYRMSRTSWRGIRFGYRGDRKEFTLEFLKNIGLTIITLGIYGSWMSINLRKYIIGNIRFGNSEFEYDGDGAEYFVLNLKGYFLSIFTLGIYTFWWQKDLFDYYVNNLSLHKENEKLEFQSNVTGSGFFGLSIVNFFIVVFTLGLGYSWAITRSLKYLLSNIELEGNLNLDNITQTEANYNDATGEDLEDALDMDFVL
jgi:uncharacterized membrane protein YjgN (DUF898 family)